MMSKIMKFLVMYSLFRFLYRRRYRLLNWILENDALRLTIIHALSKSRW